MFNMYDSDRSGKHCPLCGYEVFNWQKDEYNVYGDFCPECSLEVEDYTHGDEDDILEIVEALW